MQVSLQTGTCLCFLRLNDLSGKLSTLYYHHFRSRRGWQIRGLAAWNTNSSETNLPRHRKITIITSRYFQACRCHEISSYTDSRVVKEAKLWRRRPMNRTT